MPYEKPVLPSDTPRIILEATKIASAGRQEEALRLALKSAHSLQEQGFSRATLMLLNDMEKIVSIRSFPVDLRSEFLILRGLAQVWQGMLDNARHSFNAAMQLVVTGKPSKLRAESIRGLGLVEHFRGRFDLAREQYERSLSVAMESNDPALVFKLEFDLISLALEEGSIELAERLLNNLLAKPIPAISSPAKLMVLAVQGELAKERGQFDQAEMFFQRVLRAARRRMQPATEVRAMRALGDVRLKQARPGAGVRWFRNALRRIEPLGTFPEEVGVRLSLAHAFYELHRYNEAVDQLESARALASDVGDSPGLVRATAFLGELVQASGELELAGELLEQAARLALELGSQPLVTHTLEGLASNQRSRGNLDDAMRTLEIALSHLPPQALDARIAILNLSGETLLNAAESSERAAAFYGEAVVASERLGDEARVFLEAVSAGAALSDAGLWDESVPFFTRALGSAEALGSEQMNFHTRTARGTSLAAAGDFALARADFDFTQAMAERNQDRAMAAIAHLNLGILDRQEGKRQLATEYLQGALLLAVELENELLQARILVQLAEVLFEMENWQESEEQFRRLGVLSSDLELYEAEMRAAAGLGNLAYMSGHFDDAIRYFDRAVVLGIENANPDNLGRYLISLSESHLAISRDGRLRKTLSRILRRAQIKGAEPNALLAFAKAGDWFLSRSRTNEAAMAYGLSIILTIGRAGDNLDQAAEVFRGFIQATETIADRQLVNGASSLYKMVLSVVENEAPRIGSALRMQFGI